MHLPRPLGVRVLRHHPPQRRLSDPARAFGVERLDHLRHFRAVARHEHFALRLEERIDALIAEKTDLVRDVVEGGERLLTEMANDELLKFVALDVNKALES